MPSIQNPTKCNDCGSDNLEFVKPPYGTSYVLTTINQSENPPAFNPTSGLPVYVFGCLNCGSLSLKVESLRKE